MFDRQTVIVLGAGASAQVGFPLGEELRNQLIAGIANVKSKLEESNFTRLELTGAHNVGFFSKNRFFALASYMGSPLAQPYLPEDVQPAQTLHKLFEFHKDIASQTHDTVDQFIWANPNHQFIGKVLLSQQIMLEMYERVDNELHLRAFADREYDGRRNWYQQLINHIIGGAQNNQSLMQNELSVVTFNYDHSLERALETNLASSTIHRGADYKKVVGIFHVNGTPSKLPHVVTDVGKFIMECAQNFSLVEEEVSSEVEQVRIGARREISNAVRVFVMGFRFDRSNVEAIGLGEHPRKGNVFCLNFDGHLGLTQRIIQLGFGESGISAGSQADPRYIDQALADGFLEQ